MAARGPGRPAVQGRPDRRLLSAPRAQDRRTAPALVVGGHACTSPTSTGRWHARSRHPRRTRTSGLARLENGGGLVAWDDRRAVFARTWTREGTLGADPDRHGPAGSFALVLTYDEAGTVALGSVYPRVTFAVRDPGGTFGAAQDLGPISGEGLSAFADIKDGAPDLSWDGHRRPPGPARVRACSGQAPDDGVHRRRGLEARADRASRAQGLRRGRAAAAETVHLGRTAPPGCCTDGQPGSSTTGTWPYRAWTDDVFDGDRVVATASQPPSRCGQRGRVSSPSARQAYPGRRPRRPWRAPERRPVARACVGRRPTAERLLLHRRAAPPRAGSATRSASAPPGAYSARRASSGKRHAALGSADLPREAQRRTRATSARSDAGQRLADGERAVVVRR